MCKEEAVVCRRTPRNLLAGVSVGSAALATEQRMHQAKDGMPNVINSAVLLLLGPMVVGERKPWMLSPSWLTISPT